jgi:hypothetical protein
MARAMSDSRRGQRRYLTLLLTEPVRKRDVPLLVQLATSAILGRSRDARWLALNVIGNMVPARSAYLWPEVVKWGSVRSKDVRAGVACFLVEHMLEHDFLTYFNRAKRLIEKGNRRFAFTLAYCQKLGQGQERANARRFDTFIGQLATTHREVAVLLRARAKRSPRKSGRDHVRTAEAMVACADRLAKNLDELMARVNASDS